MSSGGREHRPGGTPIYATYSPPTRSLAAAPRPILGRASVRVALARTAGSCTVPVAASILLGTSSARTGARAARRCV